MRDILNTIGISAVDTASSGDELSSKIRRFEPSVIITDWYMEPLNGLEFLKRLRAGDYKVARDLPVVFLSSQQTVAHVQTAINEGVDHFLVKPFTISMVERAIYQIVTRKRLKAEPDVAMV